MCFEQIINAIRRIKKNGRVITNVYSLDILKQATFFLSDANAILLSFLDHNVNRLYYYAHKLEDIKGLISKLPNNEYVIEIITDNPDDYSNQLKALHFICLAHMLRMALYVKDFDFKNKAVAQYYDAAVGRFPDTTMACMINRVLWNKFDTRVCHLLNDNEIREAINNKEITIHQNPKGDIDAIQHIKIQPKRMYINFSYNEADKKVIHAMLQNRLKDYILQGGSYVYGWVDSTNIACIKYIEKYGFQYDGICNIVYVLKKGFNCCNGK